MSTDQHSQDDNVRRAYRAAAQAQPGAEPSPQLDASILQAAHAALQKPAYKPARWSWLILPLSAAAVAILATTLVLQKRQATPSDKLAEAEHAQVRARQYEALGSLAKARSAAQPTEKQIEEIRKLQRDGKLDAAKKALAELRKKFPQYTVSEDLRALIETTPEENKAHP